jgi:hypothetical protein
MVSILALLSLLIAAAGKLPVQLPFDVTKGVIDGKVALLIWPRVGTKLIQPVDCSSHLIPVEDNDTELQFPCGAWFQPPPGTYRVWVHQQDLISPSPKLLTYSGGEFRGQGLAAVFDLVTGGRITLSKDANIAQDQQLRIVHLESHLHLGWFGRAFERRAAGTALRGGVLMPAGRAVAMITDRQENVLRLSRPFVVPEHETVAITPAVPSVGSDVVVVLKRARTASGPDDIAMTLDVEQRLIEPDVFLSTADRVYGIWYAVEARRAVFRVSSATSGLPAEEVTLRAGGIATLRRSLKLLPSARVSVRCPADTFEEGKRSIEIAGAGRNVIRQLELNGDEIVAEHLPAEKLWISLTIGKWRFVREADLTHFDDRDVVFDLQPVIVDGTVYLGDDPAAATVKFYLGGGDWAEVDSDKKGGYHITLWEPSTYVVEVVPKQGRAPPYREYRVQVFSSGTRDFHIPDTDYRVLVTDADSHAPVSGAEVIVGNRFRLGDGPEQRTSQGTVADAQGVAVLPPLQTGAAEIVVRADGYFESERITLPVADDREPHSIPIQIRREGKTTTVMLRLPDGRPAAGARLFATASDMSGAIAWQSSASTDGHAEVPSAIRGAPLFIAHAEAGSLVRIWDVPDSQPVTWQLAPRAPPLRVKVTATNRDPAAFAHVVLWVDGIAVRGAALRLFSGGPVTTDRDGYWQSASLGNQTYEFVATRRFRQFVERSLAQTIPSPWQNEIAVRVVE